MLAYRDIVKFLRHCVALSERRENDNSIIQLNKSVVSRFTQMETKRISKASRKRMSVTRSILNVYKLFIASIFVT